MNGSRGPKTRSTIAPTVADRALRPVHPLTKDYSSTPSPASTVEPSPLRTKAAIPPPVVALDIANIRRLCNEPQDALSYLSDRELVHLVDHLYLTRKAIELQTEHYRGKSEQLRSQIATNQVMVKDLTTRAASFSAAAAKKEPRRRIVVAASTYSNGPFSPLDSPGPFSPNTVYTNWSSPSPHRSHFSPAGSFDQSQIGSPGLPQQHQPPTTFNRAAHPTLPSLREHSSSHGPSSAGWSVGKSSFHSSQSGDMLRQEFEVLASPSPVLSTVSRASSVSSMSTPRPAVADLNFQMPTLSKRPVVYIASPR
ncbi:hypothetical protein BJ085DRAFT_34222 [Dimargaris cristalligena]|uniref:Uncharacterized protein n=1 Tax=Dimargaris cristalligena TaxID=215637 RepID=A0A4V1J5S5_9FUNG|nr:hypothetical protein BJ085DRAFT_34222 [Dimargaris cristalligena]|eukprot:RKP40079.1 hypothetical protein BJ085DRAFT_34222 [Dimargaris cristalligena]